MFNVRTSPCAAGVPTDFSFARLRRATNHNHTHQEAHKHQAPVAPRNLDLSNRDMCFHHTESNALPTELRDRPFRTSFSLEVMLFNFDQSSSASREKSHYARRLLCKLPTSALLTKRNFSTKRKSSSLVKYFVN